MHEKSASVWLKEVHDLMEGDVRQRLGQKMKMSKDDSISQAEECTCEFCRHSRAFGSDDKIKCNFPNLVKFDLPGQLQQSAEERLASTKLYDLLMTCLNKPLQSHNEQQTSSESPKKNLLALELVRLLQNRHDDKGSSEWSVNIANEDEDRQGFASRPSDSVSAIRVNFAIACRDAFHLLCFFFGSILKLSSIVVVSRLLCNVQIHTC